MSTVHGHHSEGDSRMQSQLPPEEQRDDRPEITRGATSTDPLVEVLATRMRRMDLVAWQRIVSWAERSRLSFEALRVLLAIKVCDGPASVSELADLAGLSLHAAYPAVGGLRASGYLLEEQRRYILTEHGQDLTAELDAAHRDGIQAYVDALDPTERRRLDEAFGITRSVPEAPVST
jgi:DNA-binding MarR family transcriptional regulator